MGFGTGGRVMTEGAKVLGKLKMVQDVEGNTKVQVSNEFLEDLPLYITFLAMNVEILSNKLEISIETILEFVKDNIEIEPMEFDSYENN